MAMTSESIPLDIKSNPPVNKGQSYNTGLPPPIPNSIPSSMVNTSYKNKNINIQPQFSGLTSSSSMSNLRPQRPVSLDLSAAMRAMKENETKSKSQTHINDLQQEVTLYGHCNNYDIIGNNLDLYLKVGSTTVHYKDTAVISYGEISLDLLKRNLVKERGLDVYTKQIRYFISPKIMKSSDYDKFWDYESIQKKRSVIPSNVSNINNEIPTDYDVLPTHHHRRLLLQQQQQYQLEQQHKQQQQQQQIGINNNINENDLSRIRLGSVP